MYILKFFPIYLLSFFLASPLLSSSSFASFLFFKNCVRSLVNPHKKELADLSNIEIADAIKKETEKYLIYMSNQILLMHTKNRAEILKARETLKNFNHKIYNFQLELYSRGGEYFPIQMEPSFIGEYIGIEETNVLRNNNFKAHYLISDTERAYFVATIKEGVFILENNRKITDGKYIFSFTTDQTLYLSLYPIRNGEGEASLFHSSFTAGLPVASAGEIIFKNGKITSISSRSGHYTPSRDAFIQIFKYLEKNGIDETVFKLND